MTKLASFLLNAKSITSVHLIYAVLQVHHPKTDFSLPFILTPELRPLQCGDTNRADDFLGTNQHLDVSNEVLHPPPFLSLALEKVFDLYRTSGRGCRTDSETGTFFLTWILDSDNRA